MGEAIDGLMEQSRLTKAGNKPLEVQSRLRSAIDDATEAEVVGGKAGFDTLKQGRAPWSRDAG